MLNKNHRLRKKYQFAYVYKAGSFLSDKAVTLHYVSSKTKFAKVGFAVTKKIGHATERNLIRRRLREIMRKHLPNLKQNYNIIIVARESIFDFDFQSLEKQIFNLLKRANLLNNDEKNI